MSFGNSNWVLDLSGGMVSDGILTYTLLLFSLTSLAFMFHLAVTPLRSATGDVGIRVCSLGLQRGLIKKHCNGEDVDSAMVIYKKDLDDVAEITPEEFHDCQPRFNKIMEPNLVLPERLLGSSYGGNESSLCSAPPTAYASQVLFREEADITVSVASERGGLIENSHEGDSDSLMLSSTLSTFKVPGSSENAIVEVGENTSRRNVKVPGSSVLSITERRKLAKIFDEFWGHMFDFHGKLTEEAKANRVHTLLELDLETDSIFDGGELAAVNGYFQKSSVEAGRGIVHSTTSRVNSTALKHPSAICSPYGAQTGCTVTISRFRPQVGVPLAFYRKEPMGLFFDPEGCWPSQSCEQAFAIVKDAVASKPSFSDAESEAMILQSLRLCIVELLKLDSSGWLFSQNGGCDEEVISCIAASILDSKSLRVDKSKKENFALSLSLIHCGHGCI